MIYIRKTNPNDAKSFLDLHLRNKDFFKDFDPDRPKEFFTLEGQKQWMLFRERLRAADILYGFGIFSSEYDELIGGIDLHQVNRGHYQNAKISYFLDEKHTGKGYISQAISQVLEIAFSELKLHRIEAEIMPNNLASIRVIEKVGFSYIGNAPNYLFINKKWENHNIYALTKEEYNKATKGFCCK
ncbi:GNAT family N-acetyltransferase, partial [Bacillus toyonensis]